MSNDKTGDIRGAAWDSNIGSENLKRDGVLERAALFDQAIKDRLAIKRKQEAASPVYIPEQEALEPNVDESLVLDPTIPNAADPDIQFDDDFELDSDALELDDNIVLDDDELILDDDDLEIDLDDDFPTNDISRNSSFANPSPVEDPVAKPAPETREMATNTDFLPPPVVTDPPIIVPERKTVISKTDAAINTDIITPPDIVIAPPPEKAVVTKPIVTPAVSAPPPAKKGFLGEQKMSDIVDPKTIKDPESFVKGLEEALKHTVVPETSRKMPGEDLCVVIRTGHIGGNEVQANIIKETVKKVDFKSLSDESKLALMTTCQEAIAKSFLTRVPEGARADGEHVASTKDILTAMQSSAVTSAVARPASLAVDRNASIDRRSAVAQALISPLSGSVTPSFLDGIVAPNGVNMRIGGSSPTVKSCMKQSSSFDDLAREAASPTSPNTPIISKPQPSVGR